MKQWDVFVSHASEDKTAVAAPLSHELRARGVRVWLDTHEIHLGDSVRRRMDEGLASSRFGVVILSPRFFEKRWAQDELDALFGLDVVLPVWHEIDEPQLRKHSPLVAAKKGIPTSLGLSHVTSAIVDRVFSVAGLPPQRPARFAQLLGGAVDRDSLLEAVSQGILAKALRLDDDDTLRPRVPLGDETVDFCAGGFQPSTSRHEDWTLVFCGDPAAQLFEASRSPSDALAVLMGRAKRVRDWVRKNLTDARRLLPGLKLSFDEVIVVGRRAQPSTEQVTALAELNDATVGLRVRTYDWLLDSLLSEVEA